MSPPQQGFQGQRLPQDHMVSHCVCILRGRRSSGDSTSTQSPEQWHTTHCGPWHLPITLPHPSDLTRLLLLPWASRE